MEAGLLKNLKFLLIKLQRNHLLMDGLLVNLRENNHMIQMNQKNQANQTVKRHHSLIHLQHRDLINQELLKSLTDHQLQLEDLTDPQLQLVDLIDHQLQLIDLIDLLLQQEDLIDPQQLHLSHIDHQPLLRDHIEHQLQLKDHTGHQLQENHTDQKLIQNLYTVPQLLQKDLHILALPKTHFFLHPHNTQQKDQAILMMIHTNQKIVTNQMN